MREIPSEVATLLKSRSMIGANKPSYEVTVEGFNANGLKDATNWTTAINTNLQNGNMCEMSDGRAIACYIDGENVKVAFASSVEAVLTSAETFGTGTTIKTFTGANDMSASLTLIDGILYLAICNQTSVVTAELWKDTDGTGSSFSKVSDITLNNGNLSTRNSGYNISTICVLNNGNWTLLVPGYASDYIEQEKAFYSTNNGESWTAGAGASTYYVSAGCSKSLCPIGTDGFIAYMIGSSSAKAIMYWTGNGAFVASLSYNYSGGAAIVIGNILYMATVGGAGPYNFILYKLKDGLDLTAANLTAIANFDLLASIGVGFSGGNAFLITTNNALIAGFASYVMGTELSKEKIPVKSINISRNKNMAGSLNLSIDNKNGKWSPDNTVNQNVLFPNKQIIVKQGYGINLISTFNGLIDRIEMTTFPQELKLSVRDKLKLALDQTITWTDGVTHVILFQSQPIETIFTTLCGYAGLTTGTIETTGLSITKAFSWETYADCFSFLSDLVGFEYGADEEGKIYFRKDIMPAVPTVAYEFKEGEDIISLGYTIDDNDLYSKVVVFGKDANDNVIFAQKEYVSKDYYNVLPQKIMKIDVSEASTIVQLQAIADRAEILMRSRVREVSFAAIAVPWLQVGDIIRATESSTTISELYRITDLSTNMDNNGYTMQITCYHHIA